MNHLQHELIEEAISRRQVAMAAADPNAPVSAKRLLELENQSHTAIAIAALRLLEGDGDYQLTCQVLDQLISEVASARDALEAERAIRGLS